MDPKLNDTEMPQVQSEDEQGQDPTTLKCPTPKTRPTKPNLNNQEMSKSKIKATNNRKYPKYGANAAEHGSR